MSSHRQTQAIRFGGARLLALFASFLLVSLLVITGSRAAFTDTTENAGNSWEAGTVSIRDDATSAMFSVTNMRPGAANAVVNCIEVTYEGSIVPADVKLYAANLSDTGMASRLDLVVEMGSGGLFGDCSGFVASQTAFTGTLAQFAALVDFAGGVGSWSPAAQSESLTYRFYLELQGDNAAQGTSAGIDFVWEAQNL